MTNRTLSPLLPRIPHPKLVTAHTTNTRPPSSLIELQVFLLRHLVLQNATPEPTRPGTPLLSRRSSSLQPNHNANPPSGIAQQHAASRHTSTTSVAGGDTIGLVVLDNLASFSDVHTSATVDRISQSVMRTAGQIRWCSRDTCASVVVSDHSGTILPRRGPDGVEDAPKEPELLEVKVKRKLVEILINPDAEISKLNDSHSTAKQRHTIQKIREWLRENPGVVPLAKILSHRTRFSGPVTGGLAYAFLDRDVKMMGIEKKEGLAEEVERECLEFPHAILEVRWDGDDVPAFVEELEGSHMVCLSQTSLNFPKKVGDLQRKLSLEALRAWVTQTTCKQL